MFSGHNLGNGDKGTNKRWKPTPAPVQWNTQKERRGRRRNVGNQNNRNESPALPGPTSPPVHNPSTTTSRSADVPAPPPIPQRPPTKRGIISLGQEPGSSNTDPKPLPTPKKGTTPNTKQFQQVIYTPTPGSTLTNQAPQQEVYSAPIKNTKPLPPKVPQKRTLKFGDHLGPQTSSTDDSVNLEKGPHTSHTRGNTHESVVRITRRTNQAPSTTPSAPPPPQNSNRTINSDSLQSEETNTTLVLPDDTAGSNTSLNSSKESSTDTNFIYLQTDNISTESHTKTPIRSTLRLVGHRVAPRPPATQKPGVTPQPSKEGLKVVEKSQNYKKLTTNQITKRLKDNSKLLEKDFDTFQGFERGYHKRSRWQQVFHPFSKQKAPFTKSQSSYRETCLKNFDATFKEFNADLDQLKFDYDNLKANMKKKGKTKSEKKEMEAKKKEMKSEKRKSERLLFRSAIRLTAMKDGFDKGIELKEFKNESKARARHKRNVRKARHEITFAVPYKLSSKLPKEGIIYRNDATNPTHDSDLKPKYKKQKRKHNSTQKKFVFIVDKKGNFKFKSGSAAYDKSIKTEQAYDIESINDLVDKGLPRIGYTDTTHLPKKEFNQPKHKISTDSRSTKLLKWMRKITKTRTQTHYFR